MSLHVVLLSLRGYRPSGTAPPLEGGGGEEGGEQEEKMVGPQQGQHPEEKTIESEEVGEEAESEEMDVKPGEVGEEDEEDEIEPVEHHPLKVGIPPRWEREDIPGGMVSSMRG
jgi:hypothetical protein